MHGLTSEMSECGHYPLCFSPLLIELAIYVYSGIMKCLSSYNIIIQTCKFLVNKYSYIFTDYCTL